MRITLINPRLAIQKNDFLGSGVPYWPVELAVFAQYLREVGEDVSVIDLFGARPGRLSSFGDHFLQGESLELYLQSPSICNADAFILYAISYMSHRELLQIVSLLKQSRPGTPVAILENSQAVTAYSLQRVTSDFFISGVDLIICGEPYFNWAAIRNCLKTGSVGVAPNIIPKSNPTADAHRITTKRFRYPVPAWDLFNLEGYWSIPYSHGPKSGRFLPILTSRGCPYPCDFCVVPETNNRSWRGNSPEAVVEELVALRNRYKVNHFQIEDLNPTVDSRRWAKIAQLLIDQNAEIYFYFVSGTKAETVPLSVIELLAQAGCRYISISPESGSADLMKIIGKRFDYAHGLALVSACRNFGIRTQACFLVGHPSETESDFRQSSEYLQRLVRAGVDEVAIFIVAPFAGSSLYLREDIDIQDAGALPSFSPKGRKDYLMLERRRSALIRLFFRERVRRWPELFAQGFRALFGNPQTKMENLPKRVLFVGSRILMVQALALIKGNKVEA
jgi:anaerobic magnesium-protoporphyrin IX monomethyl ester cyclase